MRSVMVGLVAVQLVSTAWGQEVLELSGTDTTDEVLAEKVKGLTNLKWLYLSDTKSTVAVVVHLKGLTNLRSLYLSYTKITDAGLKDLQKALPDCRIKQ